MKQIKFLKMTFVVDVEPGEGCWVASSKSLAMTAEGQSPEEAVKNLERAIQGAENREGNDLKSVKVGDESKTEESGKESDQEAESGASDKDKEDGGEDSGVELSIASLEKASVSELREIAELHGVESGELGKVALRELLIEELVDAG